MFEIELLTILFVIIAVAMKTHSLTILICLELIILLIIVLTIIYGRDLFYCLIMICIGACEGAVGLRSLICITRRKRKADIR